MDSENVGWRLQLFTGFIIPLIIISVALRFYSRWLVVGHSHPIEDVLILVALVSILALAAVGVGKISLRLLQ